MIVNNEYVSKDGLMNCHKDEIPGQKIDTANQTITIPPRPMIVFLYSNSKKYCIKFNNEDQRDIAFGNVLNELENRHQPLKARMSDHGEG